MKRTYKYKVKINKTTEINANHWFDLCRELYNLCLEQRRNAYKQYKKSFSCYDQQYQLPDLKQGFPEFKQVGSQVLQDVIQRVDKAFQAFFRRLKVKGKRAGYPRFKGKNRYDSFTLKQHGWKLNGKYLHIRNVGTFKLFLSRPIKGNIKTVTVKRTSSGKWFVAFSCDNVPIRQFPETTVEVGIDVGIKAFCVDSEGNKFDNPKYFRKSEKLLHRRQRSLSRKKKGSNRRNKARILVAKAHEKVSEQRKDFLHKVANFYINNFKTIFIENLNIKGMVKNKYLSKSIGDVGWGMFFNFLQYKAEEAGREVIKVPPHNTSQICSMCGEKVPKTLSVRIHHCPFCSLSIDRDYNASLNILRVGQTLQALTPELSGVA